MKLVAIPYMGSKSRLSTKIADYILMNNPNTKYIYDLFGGGGAISFEFLQRKNIKQVFYNELNSGVVELLKKIIKDGVTAEFYQWVDRETFHQRKNDKTWLGGLISTIWSFGNNQRTYLFSPDNESIKKILHDIVVNKSESSIDEFKEKYDIEIPRTLLHYDNIKVRRLKIMSFIKSLPKKRIELERLQQLQQLQQLEQLQRLEQLQQLEQLERLIISNKSYDNVIIDTPIEDTIIYIDPPYINTGEYKEKIDHDKLHKFVENSPYKIYISSYVSDFYECISFDHRSTLSSMSKKVIEKLFCNRPSNLEFKNKFIDLNKIF